MQRLQRERGVIANPILIGAVTVLVAIVAVFLAYNANNGLPFVPRYTLYVQVANAEQLTFGAEVHTGGALVGHIVGVDPARQANGEPIAVLKLALNKSIEPLPANSTWRIRLKATIGLKYLDLTVGNSARKLPNGATVPISQTSASVDLDQLLSTYDPPTRKATAQATAGFAYGLAGRGTDLNDAFGAFVPLVKDLTPVMRNLSSRQTDFAGFFRGLEKISSASAPVAQDQAQLYVNLDTTFTALASVARPFLQEWISETPPTEATAINDIPTIRPFVSDTADLFHRLFPGFSTLGQSAPVLAQAEAIGARNLPPTAALNQRLVTLAAILENYGQNQVVLAGLDRLTLLGNRLTPPLAFLTPAQSVCNYITLSLRNFQSLLQDPVATGTRLRFNTVAIDDGLGFESVPSQSPFLTPSTNPQDSHGPLHYDPYPNTASPGQVHECSAGNEPYSGRGPSIGNPPGNVGTKTEKTHRTT
jgi:ABC-type transporter Mla subunit MlaD